MAISDYAVVAFDENGNTCEGIIHGFSGSYAELYKNWLYVGHKKAKNMGGFSNNTVAHVSNGNVDIFDLSIYSSRCKLQSAIFVFIISRNYPNKKDYSIVEERILTGIACNGYDSDIKLARLKEYFGISKNKSASCGWTNFVEDKNIPKCKKGYMVLHVYNKNGIDEYFLPETKENIKKFDSEWVGVTPEVYSQYLKFLKGTVRDYYPDKKKLFKTIQSLPLEKVLEYNQGDKFFVDNGLDCGNITSAISNKKKNKPIAMKIIEGIEVGK
jgi:hypothetical protein